MVARPAKPTRCGRALGGQGMILVFGKNGQVAQELQSLVPDAIFLSRSDVDLTDAGACAVAIEDRKPTAVINAAAYTAVDKAESDQDACRRVNTDAPIEMAKTCAALDIPFIHISTDYVFDGSGGAPFKTNQATGPLGIYGATKLAGEVGVEAAGGTYAILRTSWVFSAHGNNFVKTMLRLSETRGALNVVADQIGGPTSARAIAEACILIAAQLKTNPDKSGVYHFSGTPDVSWAEFARGIFDLAGRNVAVTDIPSSDYPTPAKRPLNSRLDCSKTFETFDIQRPDWRDELSFILKTLETTT